VKADHVADLVREVFAEREADYLIDTLFLAHSAYGDDYHQKAQELLVYYCQNVLNARAVLQNVVSGCWVLDNLAGQGKPSLFTDALNSCADALLEQTLGDEDKLRGES